MYCVNQKPVTLVMSTSDVSSIRCAGNNLPSSCLNPLSEWPRTRAPKAEPRNPTRVPNLIHLLAFTVPSHATAFHLISISSA